MYQLSKATEKGSPPPAWRGDGPSAVNNNRPQARITWSADMNRELAIQ